MGGQIRPATAGRWQQTRLAATTTVAKIETAKTPVNARTSPGRNRMWARKAQGPGPRQPSGSGDVKGLSAAAQSLAELTQQEETAGVQRGREKDLLRVPTRGVVQQSRRDMSILTSVPQAQSSQGEGATMQPARSGKRFYSSTNDAGRIPLSGDTKATWRRLHRAHRKDIPRRVRGVKRKSDEPETDDLASRSSWRTPTRHRHENRAKHKWRGG